MAVLAAEAVVTGAAAEAVGTGAAVEGGVVLAHDVVVAVAELRGRGSPRRRARPTCGAGPRAVGARTRCAPAARQSPSQAPQVRQQGGQRARGLGTRCVGWTRLGLAGGGGQEQEGREEQEGRHEARRRSGRAARLSGESRLERRAGERWAEVGRGDTGQVDKNQRTDVVQGEGNMEVGKESKRGGRVRDRAEGPGPCAEEVGTGQWEEGEGMQSDRRKKCGWGEERERDRS